jgi:transcriptional regulator with XRE-family HTH domain
LAELSGLNYKYIGRIELAKSEPGADVLVRLARALLIPVGEIFATITPDRSAPPRVSPSELESLRSAAAAVAAIVERLVDRQPPPLPSRAPRRRRR